MTRLRTLAVLILTAVMIAAPQSASAVNMITAKDPARDFTWVKPGKKLKKRFTHRMRSIDISSVTWSSAGKGAAKRIYIKYRVRNVWTNNKHEKQGFKTRISKGNWSGWVGSTYKWNGPKASFKPKCDVRQTKFTSSEYVIQSFPVNCLPRGKRTKLWLNAQVDYVWKDSSINASFAWDDAIASRKWTP